MPLRYARSGHREPVRRASIRLVERQLSADVGGRRRAGKRILAARAQDFFSGMQDDLDVRASLVRDERGTGCGRPANQRKRNFFEKLKTRCHSD
jgi:hypothetical protein